MLQRRDVPTLTELARQDVGDDEKPRQKPLKDYEPGFVHIDIKHLPQMPGEQQKRYLYVAIDRATRWVYLEVRRSQSTKDAQAFMREGTAQDSDSAHGQCQMLHRSLHRGR